MSERVPCEVCGAKVHELRRRRCNLCYTQWAESRPVGLGAKCICCGERRRAFLKSAELLGAFVPVCFSCAGRVSRLRAVPRTYAELRIVLDRDRRQKERRVGKPDTRVFKTNRRKGERRQAGPSISGDQFMTIDDDMILEIQELADEMSRNSKGSGDVTRIHHVGLVV